MLSSADVMTIDRDSTFFRNLPDDFILGDDSAQRTLFREYGAVFIARGGAIPPNKVVFRDESDVSEYQSKLAITREDIGGFPMELQSPAMRGLLGAIDEAGASGLTISPRGADSARRNYEGTVELWRSRVEPALDHWVRNERMSQHQADAIRQLAPYEQVPEIFTLESEGIYFAKDLSKSIIYSVAPPGASQHLSLLAFDVAQFDDPEIRSILARHYWYQTVASDLPHFTFLGVPEVHLPELGLRRIVSNDRPFWVPDI